MGQGASRRNRKLGQERARRLRRERALWAAGVRDVAGVDEVGVGPLAGPVVAAAVVFAPDVRINGIRDSKRLSAKRRLALAAEIRAVATGVGVGVVDVAELDRRNVHQAGLVAMARAVRSLPSRPEHLLVDARRVPGWTGPQTNIIRGDDEVYAIGAASIVAKVVRDGWMEQLDERYPGYGFGRNAGYGTAEHMAALERLGPSPAHRRSFAPVGRLASARRTNPQQIRALKGQAAAAG